MSQITHSGISRKNKSRQENLGEIQPRRKVGLVIVRSADLGSSFFHGPRPGRNFPVWNDNENWAG